MALSFSGPVEGAKLVVASFGGGVQSTTMLLMAAHGEISPMPDVALYADLESEGDEVREHVRWMASGNVLPFPVEIIPGGDLRQRTLDAAARKISNAVPFFTPSDSRAEGQLKRACTRDFKVRPQDRRIRELIGYTGRRVPADVRVEHWIGIGAEEIIRATPSGNAWQIMRWPLIEKEMRRHHCEAWLVANGYPVPPKSRCIFCPYTSDDRWAALKAADSPEWREAVRIDLAIRSGFAGSRFTAFVHRSLVPLGEAVFNPGAADDLFNHECKGRCGV